MSLQLSGIISLLHNHHKMTEIDIRLRYFLASSIEEMLTKVFPHCQANLFGSSVNGLGNTGCDLDVDIDFSWDVLLMEETTVSRENHQPVSGFLHQ
jgi:DNA polymerase sigma